ncbi:MAG: 2-isopropylmalate synthase [Candidatus Dadabacteria bacterium]|nr:MAG: 2-isopropylmalate synthase [Candidatus Dadabacteria bacterium]
MTNVTNSQSSQATDYVRIFDTTLRDGEQAPGNSMNMAEKLRLAHQLARLNVDVIEAGFPISSPGDFESVELIATEVRGPAICGLARTADADIDAAWNAIRKAERARIHTFIATSPIHMRDKLRMTPDEVVEAAARAVERARGYTEDVEFSAEDATRSEWDFLVRVYQAAINAGATTLNVPDTVGYTVPEEYGRLFAYLREHLVGAENVIFSAHCHNDLGLAVANSIAAIQNGARQVECTINGIGERAGNAALEEIAMALHLRYDHYGIRTNVDTRQIYPSSRMLSQITGNPVQPNKAIVGANAFAHESGIHQDGVLKNVQTYEIMDPADVGVPANRLVLGKHSGRHAFRRRLEELGYVLDTDALNKAFQRFKQLADQKKEIYDEDLEAIVADEIVRIPTRYQILSVNVSSGTEMLPSATVAMEIEGKRVIAGARGDGPVDAALNAIKELTGTTAIMREYVVAAISGGTDAQGEVTVRIEDDGHMVTGKGSDTDIVVASARAYVHALNRLAYRRDDVPTISRVTGP